MRQKCPDCAVNIGEFHKPHCDTETCPDCGRQMLSCDCSYEVKHYPRIPWMGEQPSVIACRKLNWYAKTVPGIRGWVSCNKEDVGATEDLNRVYIDAVWSPAQQTYILKTPHNEKQGETL